MNNQNTELELNLFEPGVALIISNLEFLSEIRTINSENLASIQLLIHKFNEFENFQEFSWLADELSANSQNILEMLQTKDVAECLVVCTYLFQAWALAKNLKTNGKLMATLSKELNDKEINNESEITTLVQETIKQICLENWFFLKNHHQTLASLPQFQKILKLSQDVESYQEVLELNDLLIALFELDAPKVLPVVEVVDAYKILMENQSLISLFDFWNSDFSSEDD